MHFGAGKIWRVTITFDCGWKSEYYFFSQNMAQEFMGRISVIKNVRSTSCSFEDVELDMSAVVQHVKIYAASLIQNKEN